MLTKIKSIADVEIFFHHLLEKESLNFHPDEDFRNYINLETHLPSYTIEDAELRNHLMTSCFEVCEQENDTDIYTIGLQDLFKKLNP